MYNLGKASESEPRSCRRYVTSGEKNIRMIVLVYILRDKAEVREGRFEAVQLDGECREVARV